MVGKRRVGVVLFLLLCMGLSCCLPAQAEQETAFRLDMDSLNLQMGTSYDLVVSLINAQGAQIDAIEGLEHFSLLSQSQSSSTSIVNNVASYQVDVHLTLLPIATGTYTLKGIMTYEGQTYETNALEVTVTDSPAAGGDMPDLFVETAVSHEEAYLGEKIVLTYTLYTRKDIESIGFGENLAIDGAILKDISDSQPPSQSTYIDGVRYTLYEIRRVIMDPLKTGVISIPAITVQANVISEDVVGGWSSFWQTSTPRYVQTEAKELTIKPLPAEGKPDDFSGIVGDLQLNATYSRSEMNYGDSLVLQVDMSGYCNLDTVKQIAPAGIPGFTVYENQKNVSESIVEGQYHIQSTYELIMIPDQTGELAVAPMQLSYFNPISGQYETAEIPGTTIAVLGDMPQAGGTGTGDVAPRETINISQVHYGADEAEDMYVIRLPKRGVHGLAIGAGVLVLLVTAALLIIRARKRQQNPIRILDKRVRQAKEEKELLDLLNAAIKQRYGVSVKACSREGIKAALPDQALAEQIVDILTDIESSDRMDEGKLAEVKGKMRRLVAGM